MIILEVSRKLGERKHVIVIDDQLDEDKESFLLEEFNTRRVFVFKDFSEENYPDIS